MPKMSAEERAELEAKLKADDEEDEDDDGGIEVAILRGPGVHSFIEKLVGSPKKSSKKDDGGDPDSKDKKPPSTSKWFS